MPIQMPPGPPGLPPGAGAPPQDPMMLLQQAMALAGQNPELLAILSQLQAALVPAMPGPDSGMAEMMSPGMGAIGGL